MRIIHNFVNQTEKWRLITYLLTYQRFVSYAGRIWRGKFSKDIIISFTAYYMAKNESYVTNCKVGKKIRLYYFSE